MDCAAEIKSSISMRSVCDLYGIEVNRAGFACCPFHGDQKPSMKVYSGDKGWWCFVCNRGGSVIDFAMQFFSLPFFDAEKKLNEDFGLHLPLGEILSDERQRKAEREAELRRLERDRRKRRRERLERAYQIAYGRYALLDRAASEFAPDGPLDSVSAEYAFAVSRLDQAEYELDLAESRLIEFERGDTK